MGAWVRQKPKGAPIDKHMHHQGSQASKASASSVFSFLTFVISFRVSFHLHVVISTCANQGMATKGVYLHFGGRMLGDSL